MKRLGIALLATFAILLSSCGSKSYELSGKEPDFTARVVEEKNADGKTVPYFALNDYRLAFDSKKAAVKYFDDFKKNYEAAQKDETGGSFIISQMDGLELHTVRTAGGICYVDLDADPNYAETGPAYSSMGTNELLDEYEKICWNALSVMTELSNRKLNSRQEQRLLQMAEQFASEFEGEF